MRKVLCLGLLVFLLLTFCACQSGDYTECGKEFQGTVALSTKETQEIDESNDKGTQEMTESEVSESQKIVDKGYSASLYKSDGNSMGQIVSKIPSDRYEEYPVLHNIPLSATLYKNGEVISIDVNDPRLVKLINMFNNTLYYSDDKNMAYLLSYLSDEDLEKKVVNEEFRLELKYEPHGEQLPGPYEDDPTLFDTMIITGDWFVLINSDRPLKEFVGIENYCSVWAAVYCPYSWDGIWLELFGF